MLHCAAGIHRTGTIAYTLLRMSGKSDNESLLGLKNMREETYKGVGAWRIELAENLLVKFIVSKVEALPEIDEGDEDEKHTEENKEELKE